MDSPAGRLERLLLGVILPLIFLISIVFINDDLIVKECTNGLCNNYLLVILLIVLTGLLCLLLVILKYTDILNGWFSKEVDSEMLDRLEKEYLEADVANLGSSWAKMEIGHLESKHEEE
ncbi:MAG: hypothetical protein ACKVI6_05620 [Candidatus Poseidoniales archaeon]|jgi:hypothetical protein|tara:strand:+ start:157 stop:513 length:357 start_codon:yes stop_codon:yes gene_type:complete